MESREVRGPEDLNDLRSAPLLEQWTRLARTAGGVPAYRAFDILGLPPALWPWLMVVERVDGGADWLYRVVGTEIEAHNGFTARGRRLSQLGVDGHGHLAGEFRRTLDGGRPRISLGTMVEGDRNFRRVDRLLCPFLDAHGAARVMVGTLFFHPSSAGDPGATRRSAGDESIQRPKGSR